MPNAKMQPIPKRVYAVVNGDDNEALEWHTSRKRARASLDSYNALDGYEPNCTIVEYERRKT